MTFQIASCDLPAPTCLIRYLPSRDSPITFFFSCVSSVAAVDPTRGEERKKKKKKKKRSLRLDKTLFLSLPFQRWPVSPSYLHFLKTGLHPIRRLLRRSPVSRIVGWDRLVCCCSRQAALPSTSRRPTQTHPRWIRLPRPCAQDTTRPLL